MASPWMKECRCLQSFGGEIQMPFPIITIWLVMTALNWEWDKKKDKKKGGNEASFMWNSFDMGSWLRLKEKIVHYKSWASFVGWFGISVR